MSLQLAQQSKQQRCEYYDISSRQQRMAEPNDSTSSAEAGRPAAKHRIVDIGDGFENPADRRSVRISRPAQASPTDGHRGPGSNPTAEPAAAAPSVEKN